MEKLELFPVGKEERNNRTSEWEQSSNRNITDRTEEKKIWSKKNEKADIWKLVQKGFPVGKEARKNPKKLNNTVVDVLKQKDSWKLDFLRD